MRKVLRLALCLCILAILPMSLFAEDFLSQANALWDKTDKGERTPAGIAGYKQSGDMFVKALETTPSSYEAAWKASRSYRAYAEESKKKNVAGYEAICKEYGKLGMKYAEKAIALNTNGVEGHFWYACSVGSYADGVSILRAIKEGLKDKTQSSLEKAYQINKMFDNGAPTMALGHFWQVLPWPLANKDLALKYLGEYHKLNPNNTEGLLYYGQILAAKGQKDEAKKMLQKAAAATKPNDKFYADKAKKELAGM